MWLQSLPLIKFIIVLTSVSVAYLLLVDDITMKGGFNNMGPLLTHRLYENRSHKTDNELPIDTLSSLDVYYQPVQMINCSSVIHNNHTQIDNALKIYGGDRKTAHNSPEYWKKLTQDCNLFMNTQGYMTEPANKEEADFPLAFMMLFYKDGAQVERLLRAIYRPQNIYCLHADISQSSLAAEIMGHVISCLPNVFMSSNSINVVWGATSVIEPEMVCMKDLVYHKHWKYVINLTGQEYPLKTNLEMVRIIKTFNGTNAVAGVPFNK